MLTEGPQVLSNHELLTLVLGSGTTRWPAHQVAGRLLDPGLAALRRAGPGELCQTPGVGSAQACRVAAALELGRRAAFVRPEGRPRLLHAGQVAARLWMRLAHLPHEEFWALLLSSRLEELRAVRISTGGIAHCSVLPREAFRPALLAAAPAVAFAHNHPSGDATPSSDDLRLQLLLEEAGRTLGVRVVDQLVLAEGGIHSAREGYLPPPPPPEREDEGPGPGDSRCGHA